MKENAKQDAGVVSAYQAIAMLYHALLTGIILSVTMRKGSAKAGDLIFNVYRQHHLNKFLDGLKKLGLSSEPDAVAAAKYHYLSNTIGGVSVEYMPESNTKAWVRFVHPRWIYEGAAICGIPLDVSRAMLKAWYAYNGVSLNNPRLGFVCTSEDMDGGYGLAGYFYEYDHDLADTERLKFVSGEEPPMFDPALAPQLTIDTWPAGRLEKARRNYAMDLISLTLPALTELLGTDDGAFLGRISAKLIGLQYYQQTASLLNTRDQSIEEFARYYCRLAEAQGDRVEWTPGQGEVIIRQYSWRLMDHMKELPRGVFDAWMGLWEGALISHNRFLVMEVTARMDFGDDYFAWRIRPRN